MDKLTQRELVVLKHLCKGLSDKEIASALCVSPATVRTHVHHLLEKLGLRDRTQLVIYALNNMVIREKINHIMD